jgi:hypothetical protein
VLAQLNEAFRNAAFPEHMGIKAAMLKDDWINDPKVLRAATSLYDRRCHWSEVPSQHLLEGSLGANYLDAIGIAFYLPAYINLALMNASWKYQRHLLDLLNPDKDEELFDNYFIPRFKLIGSARRQACTSALRYIHRQTELDENNGDVHEEVTICLAHPFWSSHQSGKKGGSD